MGHEDIEIMELRTGNRGACIYCVAMVALAAIELAKEKKYVHVDIYVPNEKMKEARDVFFGTLEEEGSRVEQETITMNVFPFHQETEKLSLSPKELN